MSSFSAGSFSGGSISSFDTRPSTDGSFHTPVIRSLGSLPTVGRPATSPSTTSLSSGVFSQFKVDAGKDVEDIVRQQALSIDFSRKLSDPRLSSTDVVNFTSDGMKLVMGYSYNKVVVWDIESSQSVEEYVLSKDLGNIMRSTLSLDDRYIAVSGSDDGRIKLFDRTDSKNDKVYLTGDEQRERPITNLVFSPSGRLLTFGTNDTLKFLDLRTEKLVETIYIHEFGLPADVKYSRNGTILAASIGKQVVIWDLNKGKVMQRFSYPISNYSPSRGLSFKRMIAFSPDETLIVIGGCSDEAGCVHVRNVETGSIVASLDGNSGTITAVDYSSDGRMIVSGSELGVVKLWELNNSNGTVSGRFVGDLVSERGSIRSVKFSPKGTLVASLSGNDVIVTDLMFKLRRT